MFFQHIAPFAVKPVNVMLKAKIQIKVCFDPEAETKTRVCATAAKVNDRPAAMIYIIFRVNKSMYANHNIGFK